MDRGLATIRYVVRIKGLRVTVSLETDQPSDDGYDYSAQVADTFARLQQMAAKSHVSKLTDTTSMSYVESDILDRVARLDPAPFDALRRFCDDHTDFLDPVLVRFDEEVQFFLRYLDVVTRLSARGVSFCHPELIEPGDPDRDEQVEDVVDLALALALAPGTDGRPVGNDFARSGAERVLVVSGPNQGGKSTFCRSVGQLYHLAAIGCPVPARSARVRLASSIDTHFERQEESADVGGKLENDLRRIHAVLSRADAGSVILINEMFSSTTLADAEFLGTKIIEQIAAKEAFGVYVTFVEALATLGQETVSMVSATDPEDPTRRTFQVLRSAPTGHHYAKALAERYGLVRGAVTDAIEARPAAVELDRDRPARQGRHDQEANS
ncbi:DNA mismatch repair ATPase MutS [Friedmanniella endophytica]|uniref:DNA mismatch repair ATPase MutS n=1 Tax=Microlunatus kandeliicorticis TaxID=1759536 RepID=A0A7W3P4L0_9ACTN|nr:DNA mismatch repair ATPase MutS [Microlunatus kandeliicorticis]